MIEKPLCPRTFIHPVLPRCGENPPPRGIEMFDRRVTNATACAGQQKRFFLSCVSHEKWLPLLLIFDASGIIKKRGPVKSSDEFNVSVLPSNDAGVRHGGAAVPSPAAKSAMHRPSATPPPQWSGRGFHEYRQTSG